MATVIKVKGETYEIENPTLENLQEIVGGYVELLNLGDGRFLVVNEDGKLQRLPPNIRASLIYRKDIIVGNAIICSKNEL